MSCSPRRMPPRSGTLGRGVADFYRDRGFAFPGLPGSAPPLLAQHDWAHVLAGYGTALENEIEVFGLMARANDDPRAFTRLADAMRRGALTQGSHDFLDIDWFALADRPLPVIRREIGLVPKDAAAVTAGSVGPWQTGGISDYQIASARAAAAADAREYVPWAPDPSRD